LAAPQSGRLIAALTLAAALLALAALALLLETSARRSCAPFQAPGTEVWLALGQSNAGNHAEIGMEAGPQVSAFEEGRCLAARDPLPGSDGDGGSVWTPLAELWARSGKSERVLVAVTAKAATSIAEWQPGGSLNDRAQGTIAALQRRDLKVSRILWLQGEADAIAGTSETDYAEGLAAALEPLSRAAAAPVFIATVGRCGNDISPAVRAAQARVVAASDWALPGPDLDLHHPGRAP
jgi:hypothetical protein